MKTKTLFLIAFICLSSYSLFSQEKGRIIYTDFEPDSVIYPVWFAGNPLDINYDGIKEIRFKREPRLGYGELLVDDNNWDIKKLLNDDIPLSSYTNWSRYMEIPHGDFHVGLRHYVGNENYYYGWIRFNVRNLGDEGPLITIHDMAYCTIPNYPLMFGQKDFMDIEENEYATANASLFPNPVEDRLSLQLSGNASCKNVEIYGIDGRLLKSQNDDFENIDVSALPTGLYIAKINLNDGTMFTEKVVVK